ncbi:vanadium-dependent haloperoxidase [Spirosoma luteum]|uniref:vanadium-dependent haloperoxidase n=1 Tax=Spirosoma luteum TaxID=431553 RepID=UPI0003770B3F|nr:vanadium-dependent haloperoxidase [Spirosoma luteum]
MTRLLLFWLLFGSLAYAEPTPPRPIDAHLQPSVFALTMVMIHDVASPPAASRFYTYCLLGAHDIVAQHKKEIPSPSRLIHDFPLVSLGTKTGYDYQVAALYCILETGRQILPSGYMLEEEQKKLLESLLKEGYSQSIIDQSVLVAQAVAKRVLTYAATDNYRILSTKTRYRPIKGEGYWFPTPPGYIEAIEPNWRIIRPLMLDSCAQFKPAPPVTFSKDTSSTFFALAREVYEVGNKLTDEQRAVAAYWDCNPFAINTSGHMSIGFKKISPGGHWMNIASLASTQAKLPFGQAIMVQSLVAMTLMDSFISCWDEKYRSNRIRPETVINRYISPRWQPLLQTPPFPEYTSGHSVISTAAAEILTYLMGDNFAFTDNTEIIFDLPERSFTSFKQAAEEAAISRLYGGIHYRDAVVDGQAQGRIIGRFIRQKIKQAGVIPIH